MLVLSRQPDTDLGRDVIVLELPGGERVRIILAAIYGQTAKIGIEASRDIRILRGELLSRAEREATR